jgi:hypothetical protein
MKRYLPFAIVLMFMLFVGAATQPAYGQNQLLKELAKEDRDSRSGKEIARTDAERIKLVLSQIGAGEVKLPEDKFNAALVLDHTPLTFRDKLLVSTSPDNYLLAHYLAKSAFEAGYKPARELVAMTIDRYLTFTVGYQKYGTNRIINQETGQEELVPIDRETPDSERAKYGISSLAELLKRYPEQPRKKP